MVFLKLSFWQLGRRLKVGNNWFFPFFIFQILSIVSWESPKIEKEKKKRKTAAPFLLIFSYFHCFPRLSRDNYNTLEKYKNERLHFWILFIVKSCELFPETLPNKNKKSAALFVLVFSFLNYFNCFLRLSPNNENN